jgi:hypothetical protein
MAAVADFTCPRTIVPPATTSPAPTSPNWYGSDALAAMLPSDGVWPTTAPGAVLAVKLFWRSANIRPGAETNLHVTVKELTGAPVTARVSRATNASSESLGGWTMLTGIDFPKAGCFEITGKYLGQELKFVVETMESEPYRRSRRASS